uniref:Telomerase reverse transcriptase n=1 Tax=Paramecium tetraurelia TaxID=5888 RepID=Q8MUQ8_PARTE|nr:telomerase reverse transcriptase [Paramecium tetraurelia]
MLFTLKNIQQFQSVFTFQQYLLFIGAEFDQNTIFYQTTLICSDNIPLKKFPIIKPSNFLYQKLFEEKKKDENKCIQYSNNENNFQNKKYFLVSQKLILSDEMETFYKIVGEQNIDFILQNFKILIKEDTNKETYIQIWGEPIMKNTIKQKSNNQEKICRQQILYCNHMSRQVGFFKKNFISQAKKEIIMRNFIPKEQISNEMISMKATSNIFDQCFFEGKFKEQEKQQLRILTQKLITNMQKFNFPQAFKIFVPLPTNYLNLKKEVSQSIKQNLYYIPNLYDEIYKNFLSYDQVISILRYFLRTIIPIDFLGQSNLYTFLKDLSQFITFLRFEDQNYLDYINRLNVFQIPWMNSYFSKKKQKILISKKRQQLLPIFRFLFQLIIIPFLRHNFYITERMKDDWKLFYYRKEIWTLVLKLSLNQLSSNNLKQISPEKITTQYIGKLRIVPKPGTFRPIVTYNRKSRISKLSLNKKLLDIKYVLRNLRSQQLGFSVFGNPQIFNRLEEFKKLWIKYQFPQTYFMSMDIHKCYDSIQLEFLLKFIEESNLIQSAYVINKYYLIIRNNRQSRGSKQMRELFNIFDRTCAIPINNPQALQKGYIEYIQQNKLAIIANLGIQTTVTFSEFLLSIKELCQNNIVQFEDRYFIQTLGIPQGLNISGILCSFYIANIEKNLTRKLIGDTLIMRLTDDYCCLTFDKQNLITIKNNFKEVEKQYSIHLNDDKTQHNIDQKIVSFKWIGKIINLDKLTLKPAFAQEKDSKFSNQINVNLPSRINSYFFKAKLKSLMLNQFKFFFNPKINDQPTLIKIAKTFIHAGLIKLINFMEKAKLFKVSKQKSNKIDFLKIIKQVQIEIANYCFQQAQERGSELDQNYILRIIKKQLQKTIKNHKKLKTIINYKNL